MKLPQKGEKVDFNGVVGVGGGVKTVQLVIQEQLYVVGGNHNEMTPFNQGDVECVREQLLALLYGWA